MMFQYLLQSIPEWTDYAVVAIHIYNIWEWTAADAPQRIPKSSAVAGHDDAVILLESQKSTTQLYGLRRTLGIASAHYHLLPFHCATVCGQPVECALVVIPTGAVARIRIHAFGLAQIVKERKTRKKGLGRKTEA
jgi:hypothetical protein